MSAAVSQYVYRSNQNEYSKGFLTQIKDYFEREGAFRAQRFASDILALGAELRAQNGKPLGKLQRFSDIFKAGAVGLTIPQAVTSTISAGQAATTLMGANLSRGVILDVFQKVSESICMLSSSAFLFTGSALAKVGGDVFGACADAGDVAIAADRLYSLCDVSSEKKISTQAKDAIAEEKTLFYMKLAKAVAAAAAGVFGLLGFILGAPLVPSITLLVLSVVSSAFSIAHYFYDKNRIYNEDNLVEAVRHYELQKPDAAVKTK